MTSGHLGFKPVERQEAASRVCTVCENHTDHRIPVAVEAQRGMMLNNQWREVLLQSRYHPWWCRLNEDASATSARDHTAHVCHAVAHMPIE